MAVDRAIDSTEFDSKLTTVADAIRTAGGTTEPMSFPSGMVEAISVLKSGSEAGGGFVSGTITPASSAIQTITHNLGKQPTGIAIWCSLSASKNKKNGVYSVVGDEIGQYCSTYFSTVIEGYLASPISGFSTNCAIAEANDTTFKCALFGQAVSASFATLLTGVEYRWYVW